MADYTSTNNGWVEMYLTALLGDGLSKEYVAGHEAETEETKAIYFIKKMIDDDEERIVVSWRKAQVRPGRAFFRCSRSRCWHPCSSQANMHAHLRTQTLYNQLCFGFVALGKDFPSVP